MNILDVLGKRILFYDGATGTYLQENGLEKGEYPELMNITNPDTIVEMHRQFIDAGSDIILTNTFGANTLKFESAQLEEIIRTSVANAKKAIEISGRDVFISYDIGPSGKLLKPMGDLPFEDAYCLFKEQVLLALKYGVHLITIETMTDLYEVKAAILAVKENSNLPLFVTMSFDMSGKLLTGTDVKTTVATLEGLRVDALGINCGMGPVQMKSIAQEITEYSSLPLVVTPNAGLPRNENDHVVYDITANEFAETMKEICLDGAWVLGGCCGTTKEHILATIALCKDLTPKPITKNNKTLITSYAECVEINDDISIIGERINPTGKPKFRQALKENNIDFILNEAFLQVDHGADILDVNVGLPDIDEPKLMKEVIIEIQTVIKLPLQIDTSDVKALEAGLRCYNGKALINSVSGKQAVMDSVFPLVKKYGGVVVALTLDDDGIPDSAEQRLKIAENIINEAKKYSIDKKDIIIDPLAMTISSEPNGANTTLKALKLIRNQLDVNTVLGVSNISFGLPNREKINSNFFTLAMFNGLTCAIINPNSTAMMDAYYSFRALKGLDENCLAYIKNNSNQEVKAVSATSEYTLIEAVKRGLKERAFILTEQMLKEHDHFYIIDEHLIPALDYVGKAFEKGEIFLPQLLMSAETAKMVFNAVNQTLDTKHVNNKGSIVLATVKGDIHDIGKNIVKVLLENYGYSIIDLGKDVAPIKVLEAIKENNIKLVGLSALMTTTVASMKETIALIRSNGLDCKVMVGGAVLSKEYANSINADFYAKDAMASVNFAHEIFAPHSL